MLCAVNDVVGSGFSHNLVIRSAFKVPSTPGAPVINALGIAACCSGVNAIHCSNVNWVGESSITVCPLVLSSDAFKLPVNLSFSSWVNSVPALFTITWPPDWELPPPD